MTTEAAMNSHAVRPVSEPRANRQYGYDLARALAVIGMVIVNFKIAMGAETAGPGWLVWLVGLIDGRAAAAFVILAGVGMSLLSRKARLSGDLQAMAAHRKALFKRAAVLFGFGLLYTPIWPADILHFYGIYILIGACLLNASGRTLWTLAVGMSLAFVGMLLLFNYDKGWDWASLNYTDFWTLKGMLRHLFFNGFHPVIPWTAFLLAGIWLGRQDISAPAVRRKIFIGGLVAFILAEIASYLLTAWMLARFPYVNRTDIKGLGGTDPIPPMPFYLLSAGGVALMLITGSTMLVEKLRYSFWILKPFITTGQYALTFYVAHVVIGMGTLEELGLLSESNLLLSVASALCFCIGGMGVAVVWRQYFKRGPLEWVLRKVTT